MSTPTPRGGDLQAAAVHAAQTDLVGDGAVFTNTVNVVAGGMEDARSAYLVLTCSGTAYLLLERHNDDGEYAPQLYRAPGSLDATDPGAVLNAAARVGNDTEALTDTALVAGGLLRPDAAHTGESDDQLWETLYGFRDRISPHAVC